jgi:O-antigen/teichoic acid export membrane protein
MMPLLRETQWLEARRFLSAFTSRFGSTFLSFLVLFAVSHTLPVEEYGLYVFLFSIGSALGLIAVLGQQILVVKHYKRTAPAGDAENQALVRVNFQWLTGGCAALLLAALLCWMFANRLPPTYHFLWIACIFAAIFALSEYLQNYFRIHGRVNLSLVPREIVWRISSTLCIYALAFLHPENGGAAALAIVTLLLALTTGYQFVEFVVSEGFTWVHVKTNREAQLSNHSLRLESLYFIANNILNAASSYLETIVIGALLGLDKAGFYFVALRIAMLLTLPIAAIDTVGIPMIAAKFQQGDRANAQRLIGRLSIASFCISLIGGAILAVAAPFILHLFNDQFVEHLDVLAVLCVLAISQAFFGPGSWLLMIGGGERFFLIARSFLFVVYLGGLYGLGSLYGLIGIAVAGLLLNVASNVAATDWIKRKWGIDNMATAFFRPFLLSSAPDLNSPSHLALNDQLGK